MHSLNLTVGQLLLESKLTRMEEAEALLGRDGGGLHGVMKQVMGIAKLLEKNISQIVNNEDVHEEVGEIAEKLIAGAKRALDRLEEELIPVLDPLVCTKNSVSLEQGRRKRYKLYIAAPMSFAVEGLTSASTALNTFVSAPFKKFKKKKKRLPLRSGSSTASSTEWEEIAPEPTPLELEWDQFIREKWEKAPAGLSFSEVVETPGSCVDLMIENFEREMVKRTVDEKQRIQDSQQDVTVFSARFAEHLFKLWEFSVEEKSKSEQGLRKELTATIDRKTEISMARVWAAKHNDKSTALYQKISGLRGSLADLSELGPADSAIASLHNVSNSLDFKLSSLVDALTIIHEEIQNSLPSEELIVGADRVFPAFVRCVLRANPPLLWATSEYLSAFAPRFIMTGTAGWAQATLQAVLMFIDTTPSLSLLPYLTSTQIVVS